MGEFMPSNCKFVSRVNNLYKSVRNSKAVAKINAFLVKKAKKREKFVQLFFEKLWKF